MSKTIPHGIAVIYFDDPSRNIQVVLPPCKELTKKLSKRIYKDAMAAISTEKAKAKLLCDALF